MDPDHRITDPQRPPWRPWLPPAGSYKEATKETVLLPLRLFLGAIWLRAGIEKVISEQWWNGDNLRSFLIEYHDRALWFWRPLMDSFFDYSAITVAVIVVVAELWIGLAILFNFGQVAALRAGVILGVTFVFSGKVDPSVFYLMMEMVLLLAWTNRAVGRKPTRAAYIILINAIVWFALAALFMPFWRTLQPDELIVDPATTMSLVAGIMGVTFARRWWILRHSKEIR